MDLIEEAEAAFRKRAVDAYRNDNRFRLRAQSIVSRVLQEHGPVDPERAGRDAHDIALEVAVRLLQAIYEEDGEIRNLKAERDLWRKQAESPLALRPMSMLISQNWLGEKVASDPDMDAEAGPVTK